MKKLLLMAVLLVAGLCATAQTNEENNAFVNGKSFRMMCIGNHLAYNGVRLSDANKVLLLGDEVAAQYDKSRKFAVMGDAFIITGTALTAFGVLAVLAEYNLGEPNEDVPENVHTLLKVGGYVMGGIGVCMLPVGITFRVKGVKAMDKIANDFNNQHGVASIQLNPSIMNCKTPGMQNQCVLGATMSLNF